MMSVYNMMNDTETNKPRMFWFDRQKLVLRKC